MTRPIAENHNSSKDVLGLSLWFAFVTTTVDACLYFASWRMRNLDAPWIEACFNTFIFIAVGLILIGLSRIFRRLPVSAIAFFIFSACIFFYATTIELTRHRWVIFFLWLSPAFAGLLALILRHRTEVAYRAYRKTLPWLSIVVVGYTLAVPSYEFLRERVVVSNLPHPAAGSPNVVVVIVDALGADHLSTYGYERETSPHLSDLASEGVVFEQAISPAPWTLPAHASIFTGRYPHEHKADDIGGFLNTRYQTVGEAFERLGYVTAAFSANSVYFSKRVGLDRGFIHFEDFNSIPSALIQTNPGVRIHNVLYDLVHNDDKLGRQHASEIIQRASAWIDKEDRHRPFFIVMNLFDAHAPYAPPPALFQKYSRLSSPPDQFHHNRIDLTAQQVQDDRDAYDACINLVDAKIAQLNALLAQRNLLANTIMVVTSDHGDGFYEHGLMDHGNSLYRELVHVPLIIWAPGRVPPGLRITRPVSTTSLPATLLDLAVGRADSGFPAPSLRELWTKPNTTGWPDPISEVGQVSANPRSPTSNGPMQSLTTTAWHYIASAPSRQELYDYHTDPNEKHDLAPSADAVTLSLLQAELQAGGIPTYKQAEVGTDNAGFHAHGISNPKVKSKRSAASTEELLHALGYVR